jgi:hypothetical protein
MILDQIINALVPMLIDLLFDAKNRKTRRFKRSIEASLRNSRDLDGGKAKSSDETTTPKISYSIKSTEYSWKLDENFLLLKLKKLSTTFFSYYPFCSR